MSRRNALAAILLTAGITTSSCRAETPQVEADGEIRIATDGATDSLVEGLLNAYETNMPDAILSAEPTSREAALSALEVGRADAAVLLLPPPDRSLFYTPIARELVVIVTHPDNAVASLSLIDVRALFAGRVERWSEVGGHDEAIKVISLEAGSSARLAFEASVLDELEIASSARITADDDSTLNVISTTPGSIGYVAGSSIDERVRALEVDSAPPTLDAARDNTYPLVVDVVFAAPEEPHGTLRDFLDWILSAPGQQIIGRYMLGLE